MIPSVVEKKELKLKWYKNHSLNDIAEAMKNAVNRHGANSKFKHRLQKQEIVYVIQDLGLPKGYTIEDWYEYIDDPFIRTNRSKNELNISL